MQEGAGVLVVYPIAYASLRKRIISLKAFGGAEKMGSERGICVYRGRCEAQRDQEGPEKAANLIGLKGDGANEK